MKFLRGGEVNEGERLEISLGDEKHAKTWTPDLWAWHLEGSNRFFAYPNFPFSSFLNQYRSSHIKSHSYPW